MVLGKNTVIYDLDDTLYNKTEELGDILDTTMAEALVYDLGLKMDIDEVKKLVTQSYKIYRDGGEIFYQNYGIQPKDLFIAYHRRKPVERIVPYHNLLSKIEKVPAEQFIFTARDRYASGVYKKNEDAQVYKDFCQKINVNPKDCVFVDDSYSNLEFAKEAGMTTVRIYYKNNSAKDKTYIDYAYKGIESFLDDVLGA